ncbi:MAG: tetratricopeptide repeat protein [Prevotellaceae bacterium]|jgi:tetratricopeptide (TPR) repeat protein|nr:tetratricopeptide repeat protein [Prevotellaceae bacterium]
MEYYFEYNSWNDEEKSSLRRFEGMLLGGKSTYFDVEEFELIIDYYLLERGDMTMALRAIEIADLQHPAVTEIQLRKVEVLTCVGRNSDAIGILNRLEKIEDSMLVQLFKARSFTMQGKVKEGTRIFDRLLADADDDAELMHIFTMAADSLIRQYEYQKALRYLLAAHSRFAPPPLHVLGSMAYCYLQIGDWENALLFYNKSIDEDPHDAYLWNALSEVYLNMDKDLEAIEAADYALLLAPKMDVAYYNKVDALLSLERTDEAVSVLREYIEQQPNDVEAHCRLGECYEQKNLFAEAKQCYEQVIKIDDKYAGAYYGLASVADEAGDVEAAYTYLQHSVELEPENPEFWFALSQAQATRDDVQEALASLDRVVALDKYDVEAWMKMAEYSFMLYDVPETIAVLEQAFTANFDVAEVAYRLAALYYYSCDMNSCLLYLERGLKINIELVSEFFDACTEAHDETEVMNLYKKYKPSKKSKK